uniref:Uncharacterized protein n=1 Tax=viral metagenome TaxID=1070528 RepID=A0A6C0K1G7_9ZZZZ
MNIKGKKHIQFDLSRNQIYIIDNNNHIYPPFSSENIQFITILSSLLFLTNTILAYLNSYYLYALFFAFLILTSLVLRFNRSIYTFIIDKIAIIMVASYGSYILYQNMHNITRTYFAAIIFTFIATIVLYYYGYKNDCFCFDPDKYISENYMALVHIIGCIGHNMIILI